MKHLIRILFLVVSSLSVAVAQSTCPIPLYTDPTYKGAADPEIVWNIYEKEWWIFYTSRRAVCEGAPLPALAIGVATSKDWITWTHKGYIKVDGIGGTADGPDILWAPGIVHDGTTYHMFLTYKKGNGRGGRWGIPESLLLHLTAPANDLLNGWQSQGIVHVPFTSIDATIVKKGKTWNLFHRDITPNQPGVNTYRVTTDDLYAKHDKWNYPGAAKGDINSKAVHGYNYQEAQFSFFWKGYYWLLTDPSEPGVPVYRSNDLESWKQMGVILTDDGKHDAQKGQVRHPGVAIVEDRAFIFYFCQPYRDIKGHPAPETCYLQISELKFENGTLTCDRNATVTPPKNPMPPDGNWGFIGK